MSCITKTLQVIYMNIGGGAGVTGHVRLCPVLFGFYDTTDVFFGTLADIDREWQLGRTLADSDGQWRIRTDLCCKGRPAF